MRQLQTKLVHAGELLPDGAVGGAIFQSSTYLMELPTADADGPAYDDIRYLRLNNTPSHDAIHAKVAAADGAEAGLVTASGMAAITTTLLDVASPGDHLLIQHGLYGGSLAFIRDAFDRFGIEYTVVDATAPDTWQSALKQNTVGFYLETIANPTMTVADIVAAASFCQAHDLVSMVDNTFASPVNFRPIEHGIDLCLQSATKYLNGHSDLVAGVVSGTRERVERIRHALNHWGGTLDPHACYMLQRGMKTLALRVAQQNATALALAQALHEHPRVANVLYPGLPTHPQHSYAREHLDGYGGMLGFELDAVSAAQFLAHLDLALYAPSLGGPETLVALPAVSSHAGLSPQERAKLGIADNLVRVSVGIEATDDVVADFTNALERCA